METEKGPGSKSIPLAIIVAGLIIAGAIYYRDGGTPQAKPAAVTAAFSLEDLPGIARQSGLSQTAFTACLESGKYADRVAASVAEANNLGAQGTPFPIIVTKTGKMAALPGALPYDQLKPLIDAALKDELPAEALTDLPDLRLPDATDHLNGSPEAPVTIIEYSDLDCPFCKQFHETMNRVMNEYGPAGQVAHVFRHFPLASLHPNAAKQAEAAECAAELGGNLKFWEFLNRVFEAH